MRRNIYSKLFLTGALALACFLPSTAATMNGNAVAGKNNEDLRGPVKIEIQTRIDYQRDYLKKEEIEDNCGFKGKYFMLNMNGNITNHLSFSFRHRINKIKGDAAFFDGTDLLNLKYRFNRKWDISAGKMGLAIGSYEYERNPIEIYLPSEFWNFIPCFKFGVAAGYNLNDNNRFVAQITESPFRKKGTDYYGYSLGWYGNNGWFNTIYSANFLEYEQGKFMYYIGLAHQILVGKMRLELDFLNRACDKHAFFFKDYSLIGEFSYYPTENWRVFSKVSHNRNDSGVMADETVFPGTDITQVGGGVEFYPIGKMKDLRMHAGYYHAFGRNTNQDGALKKDQNFMTVGIQWKMDLIKLAKDIWNRK